jgi:hypothetical protein
LTERGLDHCGLLESPDGFTLDGFSVRSAPVPMVAVYDVHADPAWATVSVEIQVLRPEPEERLELRADGRGHWWRDGAEAPELEGCIDVDLGCTPATNTLPIRRLDIPVGGEAEILAAWVRFPELEVRPLAQRYRRLAPDRYDYASNTFRAELDVDEHGLVVDYAGAWVRERSDP